MKGITWPGYEGGTVYFNGVPGIYGPGVVVSLESTGKTEDEMRACIEGTPLKIVDIGKKQPEPVAEPEETKDGEDS